MTDEFRSWYEELGESPTEAVFRVVELLERYGPGLGAPYSSDIRGSRLGNLREWRAQAAGHPIRILYAFDPRRSAILLLGGDKTGDDRWYR